MTIYRAISYAINVKCLPIRVFSRTLYLQSPPRVTFCGAAKPPTLLPSATKKIPSSPRVVPEAYHTEVAVYAPVAFLEGMFSHGYTGTVPSWIRAFRVCGTDKGDSSFQPLVHPATGSIASLFYETIVSMKLS